jgi:hypothetical protein
MADPENPAPARKRTFFKKAAWQTKKDADETDRDIFSHSNTFREIVAEEKRRKEEQKRREAEEKKRKRDENHQRKRRRISSEQENERSPVAAPGSTLDVGSPPSKEYAAFPIIFDPWLVSLTPY